MTRRRRLHAVLAALVLGAATIVSAGGGAAEDAVAKGRAALKAKKLPEAEAAFREALATSPDLPSARVGLAEVLLATDRTGPALEVLRAFVETTEGDVVARRTASKELAWAKDTLRRRDALGTKLEGLVAGYVASMTDLARRSADADPLLARRAVRDALRVAPRRIDLGTLAVRHGALAPGEPLWNGTDDRDWTWLEPPSWEIVDGTIVGVATDVYAVARTSVPVSGDFDLRCEVRVLEGKSAVVLLEGAWSGFASHLAVGLRGSGALLFDGRAMGATNDPPAAPAVRTKAPVDPTKWTHLELRLRGDAAYGFVGGEPVGDLIRAPSHRSGHVAISVLGGKAAFRRIEVVRH